MENKIFDLEIQNNNVDLYSCRKNIEISGVFESVSDIQLEKKVVDILNAIDVTIISNQIEACHRLGKKRKNDNVPVVNRKNWLQAL